MNSTPRRRRNPRSMNPTRPRRPRVKLNRSAVPELLSLLHMPQTELAQLCGLDPEGDVEAQFLEWYRVRRGVVSGETHYKAILDAARVRKRVFEEGRQAGFAEGAAKLGWDQLATSPSFNRFMDHVHREED